MDFQDAQEMLMVIFNVWFKLNYISHWVDPFQHEGQWCLMFMFMVGLYPYSVSSVSSGAQTALSFTPESAHNMTTVWPSAPTGPLTTDLERSRQFSSRQFSSLQKIHSHEWPAGWLTETAGCPTGGRRRCPASASKAAVVEPGEAPARSCLAMGRGTINGPAEAECLSAFQDAHNTGFYNDEYTTKSMHLEISYC